MRAIRITYVSMINAAIIGLGAWGQNLVNSVPGESDIIEFTVVHRDHVAVGRCCRGAQQ